MPYTIHSSIEKLSDLELVNNYLAKGGNNYLTQLYIRHRQHVYKRCLFYTKSKHDSDDFVQEIFIRVFQKLNTYKQEAKFTTWLHTITVNYCFDQIRIQKKDRGLLFNYLQEVMVDNEWLSESDESYLQAFDKALSQLSPLQLSLLISKYKTGLQIKDIATSHNLSTSAIKMRLKRTREYALSLYNKILVDSQLFDD